MNLFKLKGKRVEQNLTQTQMAQKLGISAVSYNLKETGKRKFTIDEVIQIAKQLNVDDLNYFVK